MRLAIKKAVTDNECKYLQKVYCSRGDKALVVWTSVWKGRTLFDKRDFFYLVHFIIYLRTDYFIFWFCKVLMQCSSHTRVCCVLFFFFNPWKYFVTGKDVDWKRSKSSNDTKIVVWLTSALIMHVFKLNCCRQPSIRNARGVKIKLEGFQIAQGNLNSEQWVTFWEKVGDDIEGCMCDGGTVIYCQTVK